MHPYEHSSRIAADCGKLPPEVLSLCEECGKPFDKSGLERGTMCIEHVKELLLLREAVSAYASEVVASMQSFVPFGGTHLDIILQTFLQEEEKLLGPSRLKGSEPKLDAKRLYLCQSAIRSLC